MTIDTGEARLPEMAAGFLRRHKPKKPGNTGKRVNMGYCTNLGMLFCAW